MVKLPQTILDAVENFAKLPGVGEKTAFRQILSLVKWDKDNLMALSNAIGQLSFVKKCSDCGLYADDERCLICESQERYTAKTLCVVETISDLIAIEKSQNFYGKKNI